jgi:G:T-mismatch repair DNA endonuclease (very short patch repair protein)
MDDWYTTNQELIKGWDGNGLIQRYKGSPYQMLKDIYPDYSWDKSKFKVCGYSKKSCEFIENLSVAIGIPVQYARSRDGEYRIPGTRFSGDGYIDKQNNSSSTIIEFHGCDVHGCIIEGCKFRRNLEKIHNRYGKSFIDAYNKTVKKTKILRQLGYIVIEIWECEYATLKLDDTDWKKWFEDKLAETNQS